MNLAHLYRQSRDRGLRAESPSLFHIAHLHENATMTSSLSLQRIDFTRITTNYEAVPAFPHKRDYHDKVKPNRQTSAFCLMYTLRMEAIRNLRVL